MKQISVSELVEKINSGEILLTEANNAEEQKKEGEGGDAAPDQAAQEEEKKEEQPAASGEAKDAADQGKAEAKGVEQAPASTQPVEIKI